MSKINLTTYFNESFELTDAQCKTLAEISEKCQPFWHDEGGYPVDKLPARQTKSVEVLMQLGLVEIQLDPLRDVQVYMVSQAGNDLGLQLRGVQVTVLGDGTNDGDFYQVDPDPRGVDPRITYAMSDTTITLIVKLGKAIDAWLASDKSGDVEHHDVTSESYHTFSGYQLTEKSYGMGIGAGLSLLKKLVKQGLLKKEKRGAGRRYGSEADDYLWTLTNEGYKVYINMVERMDETRPDNQEGKLLYQSKRMNIGDYVMLSTYRPSQQGNVDQWFKVKGFAPDFIRQKWGVRIDGGMGTISPDIIKQVARDIYDTNVEVSPLARTLAQAMRDDQPTGKADERYDELNDLGWLKSQKYGGSTLTEFALDYLSMTPDVKLLPVLDTDTVVKRTEYDKDAATYNYYQDIDDEYIRCATFDELLTALAQDYNLVDSNPVYCDHTMKRQNITVGTILTEWNNNNNAPVYHVTHVDRYRRRIKVTSVQDDHIEHLTYDENTMRSMSLKTIGEFEIVDVCRYETGEPVQLLDNVTFVDNGSVVDGYIMGFDDLSGVVTLRDYDGGYLGWCYSTDKRLAFVNPYSETALVARENAAVMRSLATRFDMTHDFNCKLTINPTGVSIINVVPKTRISGLTELISDLMMSWGFDPQVYIVQSINEGQWYYIKVDTSDTWYNHQS